jgi:AraC-like DNA-binding protein
MNNKFRIESHKITSLFKLAVDATQNPAFGLKVASHIHPAGLHALGYSLFASSTLEDFSLRLARFFRALSDNANLRLEESDDSFQLYVEVINPNLSLETVDGFISVIIKICRYIYYPDFSPRAIELVRPEPESHKEDYSEFFRAQVQFSRPHNIIHFPAKDMRQPLPAADTELARRNDEIVIEHLARLEKNDLVRQVEALIIQMLPSGECTKDKIAVRLNMSPRSLQNKLEQRQTSYKEILDQLRTNLACQYMSQKNLSISEITYLLGFNDTSNFSRAFRGWVGLTPSEYRDRQSEKALPPSKPH